LISREILVYSSPIAGYHQIMAGGNQDQSRGGIAVLQNHHRSLLLTLAATALLGAFACAPQAPAPDPAAEMAAIEAAKAAMDENRSKYLAAENAGDAAALAALYTGDGVYMPSNMPAASGTAAIQAYYEQVFAQMTAQGSATPAGIDVAGDWAIERGSFKTTLTPKAGGAPMEDTGKYVVVGKKTGTGWKLHYLIWNSDMPLPGAP
jgi:uncharacterized protein (TIGR02246 family)